MVKTNFIHESDASKNTENIFDIKKEGKKFEKFNFGRGKPMSMGYVPDGMTEKQY